MQSKVRSANAVNRKTMLQTIYNWLTTTTAGIIALVGVLLVVFVIIAALSERKTKKLFPDRSKKNGEKL
jgi:type IV secretory pathway VirB2 component (pilin)